MFEQFWAPLICCLLLTQLSSGTRIEKPLAFLKKHSKQYEAELLEFSSIPSVSSVPQYSDDCLKAAEWLKKRLNKAGLENVEILPTEAKTHQPVVYADWLHAGPDLPTVLVYAHFDVQPAEDVELWDSPPFEPHVKDGYFWGRGVDDDKGGLLPPVQAMEAYLRTSGKLPVNIKLLLEGQEEIGSPNIKAFFEKHRKRFAADFAVSADGGQQSEHQGILALALRGATAFQVEAKTLSRDVHSGTFGGTVQNAAHALSRFIADLHLPNNSVAIPGFYDKVREITAEDKQDMRDFVLFDEQATLSGVGATEAIGEEGFTALERTWHRPSCDVVGQWSGFIGQQGVKTIVPGRAYAKISCRLVPDQDPLEILELANKYVESQSISGTQLTSKRLYWEAPPYHMAKDLLPNRAAAKVLEHFYGKPPLYYRVGGSIPAAAYMQSYLNITLTMFGFGMPGNNIHAPNEKYALAEYERAQEGYVRILAEIAEMSLTEAPSTSTTPQHSEL